MILLFVVVNALKLEVCIDVYCETKKIGEMGILIIGILMGIIVFVFIFIKTL